VHWWEWWSPEQQAELVNRRTDAICQVAGAGAEGVEIIFCDNKPNDL
jgi:phenylpyruvate tautomerase PptA (4-oxalocrotonate tautomerase family)